MKTLLPILAGLLILGTSVGAAAPIPLAPSFAPAKSYATGPDTSSVAIGDLNGDVRPELATANVRPSAVSVLLSWGIGRYQARRHYAPGRGPSSVAIGDLNADGRPDLATANAG